MTFWGIFFFSFWGSCCWLFGGFFGGRYSLKKSIFSITSSRKYFLLALVTKNLSILTNYCKKFAKLFLSQGNLCDIQQQMPTHCSFMPLVYCYSKRVQSQIRGKMRLETGKLKMTNQTSIYLFQPFRYWEYKTILAFTCLKTAQSLWLKKAAIQHQKQSTRNLVRDINWL